MEITASMVKDLRETSGAGMMDCKKALTECNGNMEEAMNYLREQREKKKTNLDREILMNKRLEETLEKRIREVFMLKSYGSFLHKVFDKKFSFDEISNEETRTRNMDKVINKLITIYETKNK